MFGSVVLLYLIKLEEVLYSLVLVSQVLYLSSLLKDQSTLIIAIIAGGIVHL